MDFRAAWNEGEIEAGTLLDEIDRLQLELQKCAAALPGPHYMNPPDCGEVPVSEQLQRMAKDAARYRWLSPRIMGADFDWNGSGSLALAFELPKTARIFAGCDRVIDEAIALTPNAEVIVAGTASEWTAGLGNDFRRAT